ncbi:Adenylate cyclase [hydrothermal vent metagenome]|uniref:Adenylate cyclase n=1 Tax=hydrothermal vent metagenome TaxID=652676 RepID=A0A3B0TXW6_9ZZZZ
MKNKRLLKEVDDVLEHISLALNAERSSFFLFNRDLLVLETIVAQGVENLSISVPIGKGIVGAAFSKGIAVIENNVLASNVFDRSYDEQLSFSTRTAICVPVFNEENLIIGVIQSLNKKRGIFKKNDISILKGFAATISLVIKNAKLYYASEQIKNNYATLLEVFSTVSSELDLDNLIQLIMLKAAEITKADRSSLFFMDEEKGELWTKYAKNLEIETVRTKKGIVGLVAKNKKASIVNNPYEHPSFDASIDLRTGYRTKSILSVPIFNSDNRILGVIQVINKIEGIFEMSDLSILEGFASQIRITLDNAQLFDQINGMKNYLNVLVENLDNGIVTIDKSHKIQTANNTFYRMFDLDVNQNLSGQELKGLNDEIVSLLKYSFESMETGKKHYEYGIEFKTEKFKNVITNLSILPMEDSNGEIIGTVNVFQDITKEKRIRSNLSRYIPQHLVNEVINKDDLSILQSKNRKCSILFSDIRNFTKLTEELGATQIVELLNKYFNSMVDAIHNHNGILDKFIGDAVMAVFGVPYTNSGDSNNAIKCALNMFKLLEDLNQQKNLGVNLNIGIGISTGNVISGNIGSEKRFEYTVIGDPVNLAARLESETKKYKVKILICENTYQNVSENFNCREIDSVLIRGKQNEVKIYAVDSELGNGSTKEYKRFCNYFSAGLKAFQNKEFKIAKKKFKQADLINNTDGPTKLFLRQCNEILKLPLIL